jgi:alcohol dehydrogenase (cytochrome c)/quinohemoprotein ethanol dehydrogenase
MKVSLRWLLILLSILSLAVFGPCDSTPLDQKATDSSQDSRNWITSGGTYDEQRFSLLTQVNRSNVGRLGLAWYFDFDTNRGQEATPLVVDGVLYTTTAWSKVFALDGVTGRELWKFDPHVPGIVGFKACCDVVNRGAAYYDNKIYVGTLDGRLIALDAKTGRLVWSVSTTDPNGFYTITGAPRVGRGKVFIGNGGAEFGVRGYVTAYDAQTGKQIWRFYTVPHDPSKKDDGAASDDVLRKIALPTWLGQFWQAGGGGTVWDSIVYDAELDQLYVGVDNGTPWNRGDRSDGAGDNLFICSIIALDPDNGKYKWHYQENPGDSWDFSATQQMTLATLKINDVNRKVIVQAPKNGFFYVIDRTTGKLLSAEKYVPANWASRIDSVTGRPIENPDSRYTKQPFLMTIGGAGGHNWQPMSFSPRTGLVYIPAQEMPMLYRADKNYKFSASGQNLGIDQNFAQIPPTASARAAIAGVLKGRLLAWDPVAQRKAWSFEHKGPWNGGSLATAGDLVFQGTARGDFDAFDATDGRLLWTFTNPAGIMAGPISYSVNGQQYVAVLAGYGGAVGLALPEFGGAYRQPPGRVLVFKLGGKTTLPNFDATPLPPNPTTQTWDQLTVARGVALYSANCSRCHALDTYSSGVVPDLKRSRTLSDAGAWKKIVLGGLLKDAGMVGFQNILSPQDAEAIRAYVAGRALEQQKEEQEAKPVK